MHWLQLNCSASEGKDLFGVEQCKIDFHSLPSKEKIQIPPLAGRAKPCPPKGAEFNLNNSAFSWLLEQHGCHQRGGEHCFCWTEGFQIYLWPHCSLGQHNSGRWVHYFSVFFTGVHPEDISNFKLCVSKTTFKKFKMQQKLQAVLEAFWSSNHK